MLNERVRVCGTAREELNGLVGTVSYFDPLKERYGVKLENGQVIGLKRERFELLRADMKGCISGEAKVDTSARQVDGKALSKVSAIAPGPWDPPSPFLFCAYHRDDYPAGDEQAQAPRKGNGADFDFSAPYRMYHGDRIPGFPQHPHRGFETITVTTEGIIDHSDSLGNGGRYGHGDLQWMTAGAGVVHGEMFPLVNVDKPNPLTLFQIWINLPAKNKMTPPAFEMHWHEQIKKFTTPDGKTHVTVYAGELEGYRGLPPPPMSWAADPSNEVAVWLLCIQPGGSYTLPPASKGINRAAFFYRGRSLEIEGRKVPAPSRMDLHAHHSATLTNPATNAPHAEGPAHVIILQGKPINEPVAQHGPFVMNTRQEIQQAFMDYQKTQFGGWPWPDDAVVFHGETRFAKFNGKMERPPSSSSSTKSEL